MRPQIVWTIFRKEITEALRDRLTMTVVVVLPILLYPLMVMMLGKLQSTQAETEEQRVSQVAIWGDAPAALLNWLGSTNNVEVKPWAGAPSDVKTGLQGGRFQPPATEMDRESFSRTNRSNTNRDQDPPEDELLRAARAVVTIRDLDAVLIVWPGFGGALASEGLARVSICYDSVRPA
ncbi:MAG: CPBP family intramembrane metalloprotease, partial [Opitutaceae bacterium]|nr:CPBP family intramembrane metalloprotease [Verrucomicrobiales bacterium]